MVGGTEKARWRAPDGAAAAWLRNDDVVVRLTDAAGWELVGTATSRSSARSAIHRRRSGSWQLIGLGISEAGGGRTIPGDVRVDSSTWDGCGEFMGYMLRRQADTNPHNGRHPSDLVSAARVLAYSRRYAALGQAAKTTSLFHSPLTDAEVLDAVLTAADADLAGADRAALLAALADDPSVTEDEDDDDE